MRVELVVVKVFSNTVPGRPQGGSPPGKKVDQTQAEWIGISLQKRGDSAN